MDSQSKLRKWIEKQNEPQKFLDDNQIVIIANIYRMPGLIKKLIAIPRMQKYNYKIFLIEKKIQNKRHIFKN